MIAYGIVKEIEGLPNLFSELDEKIFEDVLYKLFLEILRNNKEALITEEFMSNLWTVKNFNRYPESPKILIIYLILYRIFSKTQNYSQSYKILKRLCRNYPSISILWSAFATTTQQNPSQSPFSYRNFIHRILKKSPNTLSTPSDPNLTLSTHPTQAVKFSPLIKIIQGNNYLQSLSYAKAIDAYKSALSVSQSNHKVIYFLLSKAYLQW